MRVLPLKAVTLIYFGSNTKLETDDENISWIEPYWEAGNKAIEGELKKKLATVKNNAARTKSKGMMISVIRVGIFRA